MALPPVGWVVLAGRQEARPHRRSVVLHYLLRRMQPCRARYPALRQVLGSGCLSLQRKHLAHLLAIWPLWKAVKGSFLVKVLLHLAWGAPRVCWVECRQSRRQKQALVFCHRLV